ncbi:MAG TPA: UDPGP type 1 family protein [Phycisphaerae bacterium]|nr:UDPGP type 1 family protein [Phycisphaerae bacterium]
MPTPAPRGPAPPDESAIRRTVADAGQENVLRFWDDLDADGRRRLLAELAEVNFEEIGRLVRELLVATGDSTRRAESGGFERNVPNGAGPPGLPKDLQPAPFVPLPASEADRRRHREMRDLGETILASGRAAVLTVAGGQGTRLGYEGPKGAFPIGPVSGRTLFQIFAESLLAARRASGAPIPWYIMTSRANDRETRDCFEAHNYFNLPRGDVRFFVQGMMPAVDFAGKLILADRDRLAWNPDGHGGTLRALARTGMLQDMADRGIDHISYFQVDNPLVPPLDPVFLGFHADAGSEMSSKMASKRDAHEKLGHFCTSGGRLVVVEYSDMPDELAEARQADGRLRYEAGSIAIHILARSFVERLTASPEFALPFHRARKKIPYVDASGRPRTPGQPNGIKFEMFIFDALPMAKNPLVLEIDRTREFSPVKNADGEDSPATARRDMVRLAAADLESAGVRVPRGLDGEPMFPVEISPLAARTAEELKDLARRRRLTAVRNPLYLGPLDA